MEQWKSHAYEQMHLVLVNFDSLFYRLRFIVMLVIRAYDEYDLGITRFAIVMRVWWDEKWNELQKNQFSFLRCRNASVTTIVETDAEGFAINHIQDRFHCAIIKLHNLFVYFASL